MYRLAVIITLSNGELSIKHLFSVIICWQAEILIGSCGYIDATQDECVISASRISPRVRAYFTEVQQDFCRE